MIPSIISHSAPKKATSSDLVCPECSATLTYSSPVRQCACPACGLVLILTPEQNDDLLFAVLGISDLPIAPFLRAVLAETAELAAVA